MDLPAEPANLLPLGPLLGGPKGSRQKSFVIFGSSARCFTNVKPLHIPGTLKDEN